MSQAVKKDMEILIDELTKDQPDLLVVKKQMAKLGLEYSDDPLARMNTVLMALHPQVQEVEL